MRLLVTRPQPEADTFAEDLRAAGHQPILAPLMTIEGSGAQPQALVQGVDAIALTSARALPFLVAPTSLSLPLYAVGTASAKAARRAGFSRVIQAGGDAALLAERLRQDLARGSLVLHPSGADQARDLAGLLSDSGIAVRRRIVYRAVTAKVMPDAADLGLREDALDGVTFFSPRTSKTFVRLAAETGLAAKTAALAAYCLSPAVAAGLTGSTWRVIQSATRPDRAGMLEMIGSRPCVGGSV